MVHERVHRPARDTERLPRPDLYRLTIDCPRRAAFDPVERERDQNDDRHRPPAHVVHERERQDTAKESEHLFLVNPAPGLEQRSQAPGGSKRRRRLTGEQ